MAKGVGVDNVGIDSVFQGQFFDSECDATRGNLVSISVDEQVTAFLVDPIIQLFPEPDGQVDSPEPASFGVDIIISCPDVFLFDLDQFADAGTGCCQCPYDEIPPEILFSPQLTLEEQIILVADDMVQERGFWYFDCLDLQVRTAEKFQVLVDSADAQVDGFRFLVLNQVGFILQQILLPDRSEKAEILLHRIPVCDDCIVRVVFFPELLFEGFGIH